jgi:hypothetical protein
MMAPLLLLGIALSIGIWPGPVVGLLSVVAAELEDPGRYVAAVLGSEP